MYYMLLYIYITLKLDYRVLEWWGAFDSIFTLYIFYIYYIYVLLSLMYFSSLRNNGGTCIV